MYYYCLYNCILGTRPLSPSQQNSQGDFILKFLLSSTKSIKYTNLFFAQRMHPQPILQYPQD